MSAAAIGLRGPYQIDQVIAGADHGMPAISTAVRSGETAFVSGLLRNDSALRPHTAVSDVLDELDGILAAMAFTAYDLLSLELFVADASTIDVFIQAAQRRWGWVPTLCTAVAVAEAGLVLELAAVVARRRDGRAELSAASLAVSPVHDVPALAAEVSSLCASLAQPWRASGHRMARLTLYVPAQLDDTAMLVAMEAVLQCPIIVVPARQSQVTGLLVGGSA